MTAEGVRRADGASFTNMHADLGGGELCLLDHMRHMLGRGVRVHLALLESGRLGEEARALGVSVTELPFAWQGGKLRSLAIIARRVRDFHRLIRAMKPELVLSYTFNDFVLAGIASRGTGLPVLYRAQGEVFPPGRPHGDTWLGWALVPFIRLVRPRIVCTTRREAVAMLRAGVPVGLVHHIYLGVADPPRPSSPSRDRRPCGPRTPRPWSPSSAGS